MNAPRRSRSYGLRTPTPRPVQRMLDPSNTWTSPPFYLGINPSRNPSNYPQSTSLTQYPHTSHGGQWQYQELTPGWYTPTPSQTYDAPDPDIKTPSPSPPVASPLNWRIATPIPQTPSPQLSKGSTSMIQSQNNPATLSTPTAPTMIGLPSQWLTKKSSSPSEVKHGNFDEETPRPVPPSLSQENENSWISSSPPQEETPSQTNMPRPLSQPESLQTATDVSTALPQGNDYTDYDPEPPRSSETWRLPFMCSCSDWGINLTWTAPMTPNLFEGFHYDEEMFGGLDYDLLPFSQLLPDSPPVQRDW